MTITVVGSIAYDAVETPFGTRERMLGGAATHFALAASLLDDVRIVGPVGDDFGDDELAVLQTRGSNIDDVERVAGGKTFFWKGKYGWDLNTRETLDTQLNVFEHFAPKLSQASRDSEVLFLANIQPGLQLQVREQCAAARFVALDSMNLWIDIARDELVQIIGRVDCLMLNDEELRQLTGKPNLISAAHEILGWGPSVIVAKQGEYGSALITRDDFFALPAYPLHEVIDPTGRATPLDLALPGRANRSNAVIALAVAEAFGVHITQALRELRAVTSVAGRYTQVNRRGVDIRLLLAKNPAGWLEALDVMAPAPTPILLSVNAQGPDGRDTSWLWDVDFRRLRGRHVLVGGERRLDLAVRLEADEWPSGW